MLKNYLKVAFRQIWRHKGYATINILGLSVGIASCILIMLFVKSEWSYDAFHSKSDRLYRVWVKEDYGGDQVFINTVTPVPVAPAMSEAFPEIEAASRVYKFNTAVSIAEDEFNENIHMVDSAFFQMFDFPLAKGNANKPFPNQNSIILTKSIAKKYFGKDDPLGKTLQLTFNEEKQPFTVVGLVEEYPAESSIRFDMLIPFANFYNIFPERVNQAWFSVFLETFILLNEQTSAEALAQKIPSMLQQQLGKEAKESKYQLNLQPITEIHLDNTLPAGNEPISNPMYANVLSIIGILILLIACINFVTLSIGRSTTRNLEVGIRKVLGAERQQLIRQFWGEAFLLTVIAVVLAIGLSVALLKPYNQLINQELSISFSPFFILFCLGIMLLIGFIAGFYPSLILSKFNPVEIFRGSRKTGVSIGLFRKGLVVGQFVASVAMIIVTIIVAQQLSYLQNKDLGYQREQIIVVPTNKSGDEGKRLAEIYQAELEKQSQVKGAAVSMFSFLEPGWATVGYEDDNNTYRFLRMNSVDADFLNTTEIQLVAGRNFSKDNLADVTGSMIVNEALVKEYGWEDPIGKKLPGRFEQRVIGVVKDFHFESLHTPIQPLALVMDRQPFLQAASDVGFPASPQPRVTVRLQAGNLAGNVDILKNAWVAVAPNQDFEYQFLDEALAQQYAQEQRLGSIVQVASLLSIFIACMGLFGLATLAVARRVKEIGIRKVLGASVSNVVALLSKDFLLMVLIAIVIATPIAWWAMNQWLQDFAYRVDIHWWVFALAGVASIVIALATVGFQAIRAAIANPVDAIKTE